MKKGKPLEQAARGLLPLRDARSTPEHRIRVGLFLLIATAACAYVLRGQAALF